MLEVAATTDDARSASPHAVADGAGRDRARFGVLLLLFFGTGACGLIYQQLWLRELTLVFGVTVQAVSTVLAAFFGGLALGGYLAGRWSARTKRPIAWYGLLEIGVGVLAVLTPLALDVAGDAYVWFARNITDSLAVLTFVRLLVSFAVLIVPATLMGAACRSWSRRRCCAPVASGAGSGCCTPSTRRARWSARSCRASG